MYGNNFGSGIGLRNTFMMDHPFSLSGMGPNTQFGGFGSNNQFGGNSPQGLGFNLPTLGLAFNALGSLGGLYNANNMYGLARDQFNYTRRITDKNLQNQTQSYNTSLEDRIRSRMVAEGRPTEEGERYLDRHRLTR